MLRPDTFADSSLTATLVLDGMCLPSLNTVLVGVTIIERFCKHVLTQESECLLV